MLMLYNTQHGQIKLSRSERKLKLLLFLPFILCISYSAFSFSQQSIYNYARQVVDTLASSSMHGRGYVYKGDSLAANYIKNEFTKNHLVPFNGDFLQHFYFSVNTFPQGFGIGLGKEGHYLINGKEVIIGPNSPYTKNTLCKTIWLDSLTLSSKANLENFERTDFSDKAIILDAKGVIDQDKLALISKAKKNPYHAQAIVIFNNKKLTWDITGDTASFPTFEILIPDSTNKAWHNKLEYLHFFVNNKFIPNYKSQNVIGFIPGAQLPDSFIVFSAHYDHLGRMGENIFPGANDNASGCAMLLNLARYYSLHPSKYSIAFMAFGGEELGLLGSKYYVEHPKFFLQKIKFLINMDIMGTGGEGIKVVNGTIYKKEFENLIRINTGQKLLRTIQPRGIAPISDHYSFEEKGVRTFFIYTLGGIKAYHDIYDRPETLPLTKFTQLFHLIVEFVNTF